MVASNVDVVGRWLGLVAMEWMDWVMCCGVSRREEAADAAVTFNNKFAPLRRRTVPRYDMEKGCSGPNNQSSCHRTGTRECQATEVVCREERTLRTTATGAWPSAEYKNSGMPS